MIKIVSVTIIGLPGSKQCFALLDEGSTISIINAKVVNDIGLRCSEVNIALKGIGNASTFSSKKADLILNCESQSYNLKNVLVVKNLALPAQSVSLKLTNLCTLQTNVNVKPCNSAPDLLLGQDQISLIITRESREILKNSLFVSRSMLGWAIHGHFSSQIEMQANTLVQSKTFKKSYSSFYDDELNELVKSYFDIDALGVSKSIRVKPEDKRAIEILEKTSKEGCP